MKKQSSIKQFTHKELFLCLLVAGVFFMENLDTTIITTAIPAIAHDFSVIPVNVSISIVAYLIAIAIFIPISGWLADYFGGRKIFMLAIIIFTIASLMCALSTNLTFFTLCRIAQGIGGAMMVPVGRLIVFRQTDKKNMVTTISILTWPALFAPVLGPIVGGWITTHWGWPWIFFINIPLGMLALIVAPFLIKSVPEKVSKFDIKGFILISIGLVLLMFGVELISFKMVSMSTGFMLIGLGLAVLIFTLFYLKKTPSPLFNVSILKIQTFNTVIVSGSIFTMAISSVPFILPLMFQLSFGWSPVESGAMLLWLFLGNLTMKMFTTPLIHRFNFKSILIINTLLIGVSFLACFSISSDMAKIVLIIIMLFCGMLRSLQFTAFNTLCFSDIEPEALRDANTLFSTVQQVSVGMGISLGSLSIIIGDALKQYANLTSYQIAFLLIGAFSLITLIQLIKLPLNAGQSIRHIKKSK